MALGDDIDCYITEGVCYPHLKAKGQLDAVVVEGKEVAETGSLEEALLLLVWGHHIVYKYVAATRKGVLFLGKYVLGYLEASVSTPLAVKRAFKALGLMGVLPRSAAGEGKRAL